jgi:hypothetical protein
LLETFGTLLMTSSIRASCVDVLDFCWHNSDVLREAHAQKRFMEMAIHDSTDEFVRFMISTIIPASSLYASASADICLLSCCFMGNRLSKAQILLDAGANPLEISFEGITAFGYFCGYTLGTADEAATADDCGVGTCQHDVAAIRDRRVGGCDVVRMFDSLVSRIYDTHPSLQGATSTSELMKLLVGGHGGRIEKELLNPFCWASNVCIMHKLQQLGFDVNMPMPRNENVYFQLSLRNCGPGGMQKRLRYLARHCPNVTHFSEGGITAITSLLQREVSYWRQQQFIHTSATAIRQRVDNLVECVQFLAVPSDPVPLMSHDDYVLTDLHHLISTLHRQNPAYFRVFELLDTLMYMNVCA